MKSGVVVKRCVENVINILTPKSNQANGFVTTEPINQQGNLND